jgi:hypothetical protein
MIHNRPVVMLDTSAHNRLVKDGLKSEAIFAALKIGYHVRLAGISIEELMSTTKGQTRMALLQSAGRLLQGQSDCLHAHNEILRLLIAAHEANPQGFRWQTVDVSAPEYATELNQRRFSSDDALAAEQRKHMTEVDAEFEMVWAALRPKLEEVFQHHGEQRPLSLQEVLPHATGETGLMWGIAKGLYDKVARTPASDETIRHFFDNCSPFRCVVHALIMTWYDRSLRALPDGQKFHAGRNDQFMAIYLPYTDLFLTAERKGEQERCLAEIAPFGVPADKGAVLRRFMRWPANTHCCLSTITLCRRAVCL